MVERGGGPSGSARSGIVGVVRRAALLFIVLLVTACGGGGEAKPEPPRASEPRPFVADRPVLRATRDLLHTLYEVWLREESRAAITPAEQAELEERLDLARGQLRSALKEAGADPARLTTDADVLALVREGVERGRLHRIVPADERSFAIVRVDDERERELRLFDEPLRYRRVVHDETLVLDYPAWRLRRTAGAPGRPATWSSDGKGSGTVLVDLEAIRLVGETQFLPQVEQLRARAAEADDAAFAARAADLPALFDLARAQLRWRSLEPLWTSVEARPRDEQLARFGEEGAARAELRAACELRELYRLRPPGADPALTQAELATLLELGAWSAMLHGEPLGVAADAVALAGASLGGRHEPPYVAARRVVAGLVGGLREGAPGDAAADARAMAALARATPERLRALARELHARRVAEPR